MVCVTFFQIKLPVIIADLVKHRILSLLISKGKYTFVVIRSRVSIAMAYAMMIADSGDETSWD